jgi:pimeloyl-ACP methyl ester carboxylesterase
VLRVFRNPSGVRFFTARPSEFDISFGHVGQGEKQTIGLIHGSGQGAWCWDLLRPQLDILGFHTTTVDLPVADPSATYADYVDVAGRTFKGAHIDLLVAHSGGAHVVPGLVERLGESAIDKIAYLSGSFGDPTDPTLDLPPRSTLLFRQTMADLESGKEEPDGSQIRRLFYGECPPEIADWAMQKMRLSRRPTDEPSLEAHDLDIPRWYIHNRDDQIRNPTWAARAAGVLSMSWVEMSGDHSPALSRPVELAVVLASLAMPAMGSGPGKAAIPMQRRRPGVVLTIPM